MRPTSDIRTQPLTGPGHAQPATSQVWIQGRPSARPVAGVAQQVTLAWRGAYVLIMSDDDDHENGVHIHLLHIKGHLLDTAYIGAAYTSGQFNKLRLSPPDAFSFGFYANTRWHVCLYQRPRLSWPLVWTPATGVIRPFSLRRHFGLSSTTESTPP